MRGSADVGLNAGNIAVGFRTVWVSVANEVARINPSKDALLRTVRLGDAQGTIAGAGEIAVGDRSMWATTDRALYEIDPFTGRVIGSTQITGSTGMTVGDGTVWIVDDFSGTLTAFDESNGDVRESVAIPGSLDAVASGGGSVWVTPNYDAETNTVWDFTGKAVSGSLAGKQLQKVALLKDYWFDWKLYHPDSSVYQLGARLTP